MDLGIFRPHLFAIALCGGVVLGTLGAEPCWGGCVARELRNAETELGLVDADKGVGSSSSGGFVEELARLEGDQAVAVSRVESLKAFETGDRVELPGGGNRVGHVVAIYHDGITVRLDQGADPPNAVQSLPDGALIWASVSPLPSRRDSSEAYLLGTDVGGRRFLRKAIPFQADRHPSPVIRAADGTLRYVSPDRVELPEVFGRGDLRRVVILPESGSEARSFSTQPGSAARWGEEVIVRKQDLPMSARPKPTAEMFASQYPHDASDLSRPQTQVTWNENKYLLTGYDPMTGNVRLSREKVLFAKDQAPFRKPGELFSHKGEYYRILTADERGSGRLMISRREEVVLPWVVAEKLILRKQFVVEAAMPAVSGATPVRRLGLASLWETLAGPKERAVSLVGKERLRLLKAEKSGSGMAYVFDLGKDSRGNPVQVSVRAENGTLGEKAVAALLERMPESYKETALSLDFVTREGHELPGFGRAAATLSAQGEVTFYRGGVEASTQKRITFYWHEVGHMIARKLWKEFNPQADWLEAMVRDKAFVSAYSQLSIAEDFAEIVEAYIKSDAGSLDPNVARKFAARFQVLDRIFGVDRAQAIALSALREKSRQHRLRVARVALGVAEVAAVGAASGLLVSEWGDDE
jgi:hypothetical protein